MNPAQALRSYLFGYLFWTNIVIGCLSILMLQHITGGLWGLVIRRILEAGTRTLPVVVLGFVPVALGVRRLYPWADASQAAGDPALAELLARKALFLNVPFFLGRSAFYFAVWFLLTLFLNRWSLELEGGENPALAGRLQGLSGGGLVLMGLTITFSSIDWAMSLEPRWVSTIYGILFMVGQGLGAFTFAIGLLSQLAGEKPYAGVVRPGSFHDLGKLLFAFVMLWAYMNLSQFLITWSGNLPEEISFYVTRLQGGWRVTGMALVVFHFALPFVLLLSRSLKRSARLLGGLAAALLVLRAVDLFWLVGPDLAAPGSGAGWMNVVAPVGLGGLWLAAFLSELSKRPLLPRGEPEIEALLEKAEAA